MYTRRASEWIPAGDILRKQMYSYEHADLNARAGKEFPETFGIPATSNGGDVFIIQVRGSTAN